MGLFGLFNHDDLVNKTIYHSIHIINETYEQLLKCDEGELSYSDTDALFLECVTLVCFCFISLVRDKITRKEFGKVGVAIFNHYDLTELDLRKVTSQIGVYTPIFLNNGLDEVEGEFEQRLIWLADRKEPFGFGMVTPDSLDLDLDNLEFDTYDLRLSIRRVFQSTIDKSKTIGGQLL